MLNVYAVEWCPHCLMTVDYLKENGIQFNYLDMESQPEDVEQKIVEINGGIDWVVPTLEYNGKWRKGKVFDADELRNDLVEMGVLHGT
ncbi:glutaredoxin family protein [Thermodesulfobacteriota bacterium]